MWRIYSDCRMINIMIVVFIFLPGLDPAGPNFQDTVPKVRLDADDADFVDVIHTDGAMFLAIKGNRDDMPRAHNIIKRITLRFFPASQISHKDCRVYEWSLQHMRLILHLTITESVLENEKRAE